MAILNTKVILPCNIQKAWDIVTSVEKYTWRSDLSKTERMGMQQTLQSQLQNHVSAGSLIWKMGT